MNRPLLIRIVLCIVAAWIVYWCIDTFAVSEKTQMLRAQDGFIVALEKRRWSVVDSWISHDYSDSWGHDANTVKQTMRKVLGSFFALTITPTVSNTKNDQSTGQVTTKLVVDGTGAGLSSFVVTESRRLKEPWVFHWKKTGVWPWNWELVEIANPELAGYKVPKEALDALGQ